MSSFDVFALLTSWNIDESWRIHVPFGSRLREIACCFFVRNGAVLVNGAFHDDPDIADTQTLRKCDYLSNLEPFYLLREGNGTGTSAPIRYSLSTYQDMSIIRSSSVHLSFKYVILWPSHPDDTLSTRLHTVASISKAVYSSSV